MTEDAFLMDEGGLEAKEDSESFFQMSFPAKVFRLGVKFSDFSCIKIMPVCSVAEGKFQNHQMPSRS